MLLMSPLQHQAQHAAGSWPVGSQLIPKHARLRGAYDDRAVEWQRRRSLWYAEWLVCQAPFGVLLHLRMAFCRNETSRKTETGCRW